MTKFVFFTLFLPLKKAVLYTHTHACTRGHRLKILNLSMLFSWTGSYTFNIRVVLTESIQADASLCYF